MFQLNALDPSNSGSGGASLLGTYRTTDAFAETLVAGYFNEAAANLRWTHALLVKASDKTGILLVSSQDGAVTVTEFGGSGGAVSWDDIEDKPATFPVSSADVATGLSAKPAIAALVSPTADYADMTEATAAIKSVIDALKA